MAKRTPSFILDLPLAADVDDNRTLFVRFEAGRQVYNACLGEALKRLALMRESKEHQKTRKLKKGLERTQAFKELNERFGFSEYSLHRYATQFNHCWLGQHLDSNTIQKIASRVFSSVKEYVFGKRGRPRFKGKRGFHSLEGKSNRQGILFREGLLKWLGLTIPVVAREKDPVVAHGLKHRVKYCRIVRRTLRGQVRWYLQLVLEGTPYIKPKNKPGEQTVGLDVGPSTVALVDDDEARLLTFCESLQDKQNEIRRLQRAMDRSRRTNNPANYNADGTIRKGKKRWHHSARYEKLRVLKAEFERKLSSHRKCEHGRLSNEIIRRGATVRSEKVSYKAWQKLFGRSVNKRAPGMFMNMVSRKAESAGGQLEDINTRKTALSQTCMCGRKKKKKLSERTHRCECGVVAQRDLFSAYLARHVNKNKLDVAGAAKGWQGAEPLLQMASKAFQVARRKGVVPTRLPTRLVEQSDSSAKKTKHKTKTRDVVLSRPPEKREPERGRVAPHGQRLLPFGEESLS